MPSGYYYKRHGINPACMLDQPVPLSYYSTNPNIKYHPRSMRDLVKLKTTDFAMGLGEDITVSKVADFESGFSKNLISLAEAERTTLLPSEFPEHIDKMVNDMTDDELNKAFDELTTVEDRPPTLTEQQELGDIIIPALDEAPRPTASRRGTSRYVAPEPKEETVEMMEDLLSAANTGQATPSGGGGGQSASISFSERSNRAIVRDVNKSRGDY